jgi:hypothetical protein
MKFQAIFAVLALLLVGLSVASLTGASVSSTTWISPAASPFISNANYVVLNVSFALKNSTSNNSVVLIWQNVNYSVSKNNCTNYTADFNCVINTSNYVTISTAGNYTYRIFLNETDGTDWTTQNRTYIYDTTSPYIHDISSTEINGSEGESMYINLTYLITDANAKECYANLWPKNNLTSMKTVTGTMYPFNTTNTTCQVSVRGSDLGYPGVFTIQPNATDGVFYAVGANVSNVSATYIYGAAYNLIGADRNTTLYDVGAMDSEITSVSVYSNQNKNYTSYVVGVTTNNNTVVAEGDAVYIYLGGTRGDTKYLTRKWKVSITDAMLNKTMWTGWNQVGVINQTRINLAQYMDLSIYNKTKNENSQEVVYASFYDAQAKIYRTQRESFTYSPTYNMTYGMGLWIYLNGSAAGNYSVLKLTR